MTREKEDFETRREPSPTWVFVSCALILIGGGTYLGAYSGGFKNDVSDPFAASHYKDTRAKDGPAGPAQERDLGAEVYARCSSCHQPDGAGNDTVPPLADSEWVYGGTERLANIILKGVEGDIEVKGITWGKAVMPPQQMTAEQLAAVMNYVRREFGGIETDDVTEAMAAKAISDIDTSSMADPAFLNSIPEDANLTE